MPINDDEVANDTYVDQWLIEWWLKTLLCMLMFYYIYICESFQKLNTKHIQLQPNVGVEGGSVKTNNHWISPICFNSFSIILNFEWTWINLSWWKW